MIQYPNIDPVAIAIGPLPYIGELAIRWYSLAYIGGILIGWWIISKLLERQPIQNLSKKRFEDTIIWAVVGIVLGGRLGYVLFYKPGYYLENPQHILTLWEGGMSFHGGMIGFIVAFWLFCRKYKVQFFALMDLLAAVAPIGICFGRLANFINGELFGRYTDAPWGMVFPSGGDMPRHPSQLYEAGLEGVLLFAVLYYLARYTNARNKVGYLSGAFLVGYACARIISEFFREPDAYLGYFADMLTMGQLLCVPMMVLGIYLIMSSSRPKARHLSSAQAIDPGPSAGMT